jgi:hypothetical protein
VEKHTTSDAFSSGEYFPKDFGDNGVELPEQEKSGADTTAPKNKRSKVDIDAQIVVCKQLRLIGGALACKYDLSKATARLLSKGTKGFYAHKFTSDSGDPKIGGAQLTGALKLDRYISYRVRNDVFALSAVASFDDEPGAVQFQVLGPKALMKGHWQPFQTLRPTLAEEHLPKLDLGGCIHTDIFDAWEHLDLLLSHAAVKRCAH